MALDDTSHAIALGAAIGMLVGLTPTVGLQTIVVMLFAFLTHRLFYFNRAAALLMIYVSNPLTVVPLYYGLYCVGTWFVPGNASAEQFDRLLSYEGIGGWWETLVGLVYQVGQPLAVGTLIVAPTVGVATYPFVRFMLRWFRDADNSSESRLDKGSDANTESPSVSDDEPTENLSAAIELPISGAAARNDGSHSLPSERDVLERNTVLSR